MVIVLVYAVCYQNKSALKFTYNATGKVTRVDTGIAKIKTIKETENNVFLGDGIYCGERDYVGDTTYINYYEIEESINEYGKDLLTYNMIEYNGTNSVVKNEKGLKNVYYFNENGYMVSILESVDTFNNDLKTLKKMPGKSMLNENGSKDPEKINTQNAFNLTTTSDISTSTIMSGRKKSLDDYRGRECGNYVNYICSFWLKLLEEVDNSRVQLIINDDNENMSVVSFDNSAINAWQEVRMPIKIVKDNINIVLLKFLEKEERDIKTADMRLYYSSTYKTMLTNGTTWACLDEIQKIVYNTPDGVENEVLLDDETFVTEKDMQMTYMHKFKLYGNSNNINNYYPYI